MGNTDVHQIIRKLTGIGDKAPTPPQTGTDRRMVRHFYAILIFSLGMILFGIVVAFIGLF